jgi:hypothetical protein
MIYVQFWSILKAMADYMTDYVEDTFIGIPFEVLFKRNLSNI